VARPGRYRERRQTLDVGGQMAVTGKPGQNVWAAD
jgi:hypothetical protein